MAGSVILKANLDGDFQLESQLISNDAATRLDTVVIAFHARFSSNELAYRTLLNLMLQNAMPDSGDETLDRVRATRHLYWLRTALLPIAHDIDPVRFDRLVMALSAATGFEAFIALRDISSRDQAESRDIMQWIARSLLKSTLEDQNRGNSS